MPRTAKAFQAWKRRVLPVFLFVFPAGLLFTVVVAYPIVQTACWSFLEWDGLTGKRFVFLENYARLLRDPIFLHALGNGLSYAAVITVYQIGVGTILALLLSNTRLRGRKVLKTAYFVPVVLSVTVTSLLWVNIYNSQYGLLNSILRILGVSFRQKWLGSADTAIFAVAAVNAWQFMGVHMVLILAGIKSIPADYFEAARMDGASRTVVAARITLPLLADTYQYAFILAITSGLKAFEPVYIMTGGGPGTATYTPTYHMFHAAFRLNEYGYASSSAVVLVAECLLIMVLVGRFVGRERVVYE